MPPGVSGRSLPEPPGGVQEGAECHQRGQGSRCPGQLDLGWGRRSGALPWGPQHRPPPERGMEAVEVVFWVVVSGEALFERGWTGPGAGWRLQSWQTAWGGWRGREREREREREFQLCLQKASLLVIPGFTQRYLFLLFSPPSFSSRLISWPLPSFS